MIPDWLWNPYDKWSKWKGFGRIIIFSGLVGFLIVLVTFADIVSLIESLNSTAYSGFAVSISLVLVGVFVYGVGLLGLRMEIERKRE